MTIQLPTEFQLGFWDIGTVIYKVGVRVNGLEGSNGRRRFACAKQRRLKAAGSYRGALTKGGLEWMQRRYLGRLRPDRRNCDIWGELQAKHAPY